MKYEQKRFTVPMPGKDVDWPFDPNKSMDAASGTCGECGRLAIRGTPHINLHDERAGLTTKRVCFGKVIAR